jgi:DNA-binding transcriptional ArsR family regulator
MSFSVLTPVILVQVHELDFCTLNLLEVDTKSGKIIHHDVNEIAEMFKSIGHPERLQVLNLLCNCGCNKLSVKNIYEDLNLEQSVVSRHLGILKRAGLLKRQVEGRSTFYFLNTGNPLSKCIREMFLNRSIVR